MNTLRLWLEADPDIPRFQRLRWELTDVSIADALLTGVHPWMGADKHPSLPDAFLLRLNEDGALLPALAPMGYSHALIVPPHAYWEKNSAFEKALQTVHHEIRFVEDFDYRELRALAEERLRAAWSPALAERLARSAHPTFADLRAFLKAKDKRLKLSGYEDLESYDLGEILTVEDFADHDALLIAEGVPVRNFRRAQWLQSVTDERGRLRLVPEIRDVTLQTTVAGKEARQCGVHLAWHATRKGQTLTFRPNLGDSTERRVIARQFAEQWRTDTGRLCFRTDLERLSEMVRTGVVAPDFPSLNYRSSQQGPTASAEPAGAALQTYAVGAFPNRHRPAETLKEVLRTYAVSMSGTKDALLEKLAKLAAEKYREHQGQMDRYFQRRRFVRMHTASKNPAAFHVLDNLPHLENLLLAIYILKHLRGNAILDASHENDACDEEELALALVNGKVGLGGAFLQVV